MALNLDPVRVVAESFMEDTCEVLRDPQGVTDDVWDDAIGEYAPPADDLATIYTGKCMIYPNSAFTERQRGGSPENVTQYWLEVPISQVGFEPGDMVRCLTARWDPALVGKVFRIDTDETDSYGVTRRIRIHDRKPVVR